MSARAHFDPDLDPNLEPDLDLQEEATKSMAKVKSCQLQIKLLEAELEGSTAQLKALEDNVDADHGAQSTQRDAVSREREAREEAEASATELRGLLASLRGEKDAVTHHCRDLEAKLVEVHSGSDEAKRQSLTAQMTELTDVKAERAHLEAEVAHLHDTATEQQEKTAKAVSEMEDALAGRDRLAAALKKKDRETSMAEAKVEQLTDRLRLLEDEYHKTVEDHASVQIKQRMEASKAKAKARAEAGEPMSPLSPRSHGLTALAPFGLGRLGGLAQRARIKSREHADGGTEAKPETDAEHKSVEVVTQETELAIAKIDAARAKVMSVKGSTTTSTVVPYNTIPPNKSNFAALSDTRSLAPPK